MTWPHGRQTPDNNLMTFVARRIEPRSRLLDIGCGEGANARELRRADRGMHDVITLDKDDSVAPDIWADICEWVWTGPRFDCIYDVNTLCHVPNPPIDKIRSILKPGGYFFSIAPDFDTWQDGVKVGKDYTRFISEYQFRALLNGFSEIVISVWERPDFRGHQLKSWIAEARK